MPLPARASSAPHRRRAQRPLGSSHLDDDPLHRCSRILARLLVAVGGLLGALYLTSLENGNIDIAVERSVEKHNRHVRDELSGGDDGDGGGGLRGDPPTPVDSDGLPDNKFEFAKRDDGKDGVADEFSGKSSGSGSRGKLGFDSSGDADDADDGSEEEEEESDASSSSEEEEDRSGSDGGDGSDDEGSEGESGSDEEGSDDKEKEEEEETAAAASSGGGSDDGDDASASEGSEADEGASKEKPKFAPSKIRRIALLGERNSGTRWISAELAECFPDVTVSPRLLRWKHWFQSDDGKRHNPTLVVCQFRNPYDWVEAMRKVPHHSPEHLNLEWREFVSKPWTMPRPARDAEMKDKEGNVCYEHFQYNELISCVEGNKTDPEYLASFDPKTKKNVYGSTIDDPHDYSAHKPIYELKVDGSGEPYDSILDLRADKIKNFLSVKEWDWIADSIPVRYEALLAEGTEDLIRRVEGLTGLTRRCEPSPPQDRRRRALDGEYVRWMTQRVDWDAEGLIGYERRPDPDDDEEDGDEREGEENEEETEASESEDEDVKEKPSSKEADGEEKAETTEEK